MGRSVGRHALIQGSCPCGFRVNNLMVGMTTFPDRDPIKKVVVYTSDGGDLISVDQSQAESDGLTIIDCRQTANCPQCSQDNLTFIFGEIVFSD